MVRTKLATQFKAPWMFVKKGIQGLHKVGPTTWEKRKWPGQNREFPELSPKFQKNNHEALRGYTGTHPSGFVDQKSGKFVHVPEMVPELVVPDLSNFELKPYVSYKTDVQIEERLRKFDRLVVKRGSEEKAMEKLTQSEIWPPPKVDAKLLFDYFYANEIRESHGLTVKKNAGKKEKKVLFEWFQKD